MRARSGLGRMQAGSLAVLLAALAVTALLAACGSAEPTATPTPAEAAAIAAVEVPTSTPITVSGVTATGPTAAIEPAPAPVGEQPIYGGILRTDLTPPPSVDQHEFRNSSGSGWARVFYNGLVEIQMPFDASKGIRLVPGLATEWSQSQDGSKWSMKLRQGVTWHDGEVFNADDVVTTFQRLLDPGTLIGARIVPMRKLVKEVRKVDDYNVVIDTGEPNASAFPYIASHFVMMHPEHLIRGDKNATDPKLRWRFMGPTTTQTLGVGTGPFVMKKWAPEVEFTGERNPSYWKKDAQGNQLPYLQGVVFTAVSDPTRVLARFVAGESHVTSPHLHPTKAKSLCQSTRAPGCRGEPIPHGAFNFFLNLNSTPEFKDPKVVQGARYAVDELKVFIEAYGGRQGFMWMDRERFPETALTVKEQYEVIPWSNPERRGEFEQKAKDRITEAGYPKGIDLPFPVFGSCGTGFLDQFSREVDYFYRVGLRGTLECRAGIVNNDEIKAGRWSIANSPSSIYLVDPGLAILTNLLFDSPALARAPWRYEGQEIVDPMFRKILGEVDTAKRNELYRDLERHLANDKFTVWATGLSSVVVAAHGCVRNYHPGAVWDSNWFAVADAWVTKDCK